MSEPACQDSECRFAGDCEEWGRCLSEAIEGVCRRAAAGDSEALWRVFRVVHRLANERR